MSFKVANVVCRFNSASGGPPRTVSLVAKAGIGIWESELYTTDYIEPVADSLLLAEFPGHVHLLSTKAQSLWGGALMMVGVDAQPRALLQSTRPDIVHLHGLWSPLLGAFARASMGNGIPFIVSPHGMLEPWSLSQRRLRKWLALRSYQGRVLEFASAIHVTSDLEAESVRRVVSAGARIVVVPNAIEMPNCDIASRTESQDPRRTLLFMSRLHEKKGLGNLLKAWNELRPCNWLLRVVGNGEVEYVQSLKRFCREEEIPNVEFHSHVDGEEKEEMFRLASAFVLPSFSENFGYVVAEAMARGLPVITTTGTPWLVIQEERLGWYIQPTLQDLAKALREVISASAGDLTEMGKRGRQYVGANLVLESVRARLNDMYCSVLSR